MRLVAHLKTVMYRRLAKRQLHNPPSDNALGGWLFVGAFGDLGWEER